MTEHAQIICGECNSVLEDQSDRRHPTEAERSAFEAMPSTVAKGREAYRIYRPGPLANTSDRTTRGRQELTTWRCEHCGTCYVVPTWDLTRRRFEALDNGASVLLSGDDQE